MLSWGTVYFPLVTINDVSCTINQTLDAIFEIFSDYALVAMMLERCIVVFFPLHAKTLVTRRFTIILLCICILPFWLELIPLMPFDFSVESNNMASLNGKICVIYPYSERAFLFIYIFWSITLIYYVFHVFATLIFVVILGAKLLVLRRRRNHMILARGGNGGEKSGKENSAIIVMLLLSFINITCFMPFYIVSLIYYTADVSSWSTNVMLTLYNFGRFAGEVICVSKSINFIVFFSRIPSFRAELVNLFSCCISK